VNSADDSFLVWPYIDVHAHIWPVVDRVSAGGPGRQSFEKYLARMAQTNIVAAIPSTAPMAPAAGGRPEEGGLPGVRDQNDATAAGCRRHPDRFPIGLALLEVALGSAAVDEIERAMTQSRLAGLTCPPHVAGPALDAVLHPALEVIDARGGLALLHVHADGRGVQPEAAAGYARRFPRATFIVANVSTTEAVHRASIAAFAGLENVWCDLARHPGHPVAADGTGGPWDLADLVRGLSAGRLLFGTDAPYADYRLLQQEIEAARIDAPRKDRLTWGNAADLIGRFRPGWTPPRTPPALPDGFAGVDLWRQQPGKPGRLL
jgi:predicted TIM-barrel fold metal-dependent hydrolase